MEYTYTWQYAQYFEPLLGWLRKSGFFEAHVYITVMTVPAIALFAWAERRRGKLKLNGYRNGVTRFLWRSFYFFVCWTAMNSLAVTFKTMIAEEIDRQDRMWHDPYLPIIHFLVFSGGLAYIVLISKSAFNFTDTLLALYVQIALITSFIATSYIILITDIYTLLQDLIGGVGRIILLLILGFWNYDLIGNSRRAAKTPKGV